MHLTTAQKRRARRKRLHATRATTDPLDTLLNTVNLLNNTLHKDSVTKALGQGIAETDIHKHNIQEIIMSSKDSREDVLAAREAKKLAKQKAKHKGEGQQKEENVNKVVEVPPLNDPNTVTPKKTEINKQESPKSKDEVDRANVKVEEVGDNKKSREQIIAERASKKKDKQSKKKGVDVPANPDMTVKDVAETLNDIKNVVKDMQDFTAKVSALNFEANKVPLINLGFLLA